MAEFAANFLLNNDSINTEFDLSEGAQFDALFEIYASGTVWGSISGTLSNQTDLQAALDLKADKTELNTAIQNEATTRAENDTLLQNNINTLSGTVTANYNALDGKIDTEISDRTAADTTLTNSINSLSNTVTSNYNSLDARITTNTDNIATNANNITNLQTNKQDVISDLTTIRSNALAGKNASDTIATYGNIVTHNVSEFATSSQGALADTALQPNDNISELTNDAGYITGITSSDVITALGYTPYNSTNPNGYITASALNGYATETYVDTGLTSKQATLVSGTNIKTINNQSLLGSGNIDIQGGGGSYTAGNGIDITNDTISIDTSVVATQTNISDMATQTWVGNQGYLTSSALTNYVTTNTAQDISGRKTFLGEKAIYFKQVATSNKLGFTLYNPSGGELAALEYRPNTINGASLLALNCPQTTGGYVGFRYWGTPAVNIVAPKVATAGTYFMATHITDGTNTVTASNNGTLNISSLLPNITVDQTYDATSANAQSGVAINGAGFLKNTADTSDSLAIGNNISSSGGRYSVLLGHSAEGQSGTVALGYNASGDSNSVAIGYSSSASGDGSTSIGPASSVTANYAIQLGYGTNSTANSLSVGFYNSYSTHYNWQLLDGTTGLIPDERISSNIARISQLPDLSTYQPLLVSGINIKTINNNSILGSGNISTLSTMTYDSTTETLIFS